MHGMRAHAGEKSPTGMSCSDSPRAENVKSYVDEAWLSAQTIVQRFQNPALDRPYCEDTTLVLDLFMVMPHEQCCDVTAAWDDEMELLSCVECCMAKPTSYSQKALFIHTGVQLSQRSVFLDVLTGSQAGELFAVGLSLHAPDDERFCL